MNATTSAPAPIRVAPNLGHAFGGIWRLTLVRFLQPMHWLTVFGLTALLVLMMVPILENLNEFNKELMNWFVMFYLKFPLPIMTFISAAAAIRDQMKAGQVDYLFTRPIPRPAFLGFKFLSHLACTQLDLLVPFATIVGIAAYLHYPNLGSAVPMLLGAQVLIVIAFSALGFLAAIVTSRFVVVGFAYGAVVELGVGLIPTQISKLSMTTQVQSMLGGLLPADNYLHANPAGVGGTITLLLGFTAILLFIAGAVFSFMELSGPNEA
jgi:ABC-2 type transport system permease protein